MQKGSTKPLSSVMRIDDERVQIQKPRDMKDQDRLEWPLIRLLNELLKPRGFRKMGRHWRKDAGDAIIAVVLDDLIGVGVFQIRFGAWLKAIEEVAVKDVMPVIYRTHLYMDLIDPCPDPLKIRIFRALHFNGDYLVAASPGSGILDEALEAALSEVEKNEPLTEKYRVEVVREAMEDYATSVIERMETAAGLQSVLEEEALMKAADEALFKHFGVAVPECDRLTLF